eukprot:CAMPEP_0178888760 /NCGR_PEP_ID=MMETSP0747-20121128/17357_1 /TAXON_ID=913974 /ORGANISM="Nitzschia punctata, Strain CCMP561" /LENGTH=34 /DNA_ID= /DNA_START= /DNA_END= /DNA_ORIENTATION=
MEQNERCRRLPSTPYAPVRNDNNSSVEDGSTGER